MAARFIALLIIAAWLGIFESNSQVNGTSASQLNEARRRADWAGESNNIWSLNNRAPLIDCNFDSPQPCTGLVQSRSDDADWRIRLNRTEGNPENYRITGFMEAQAGPWIRPGTIVRLRSTELLPPKEGYCLRFTFRFIGENIGALTVGVLDSLQMRLNHRIYGEQNSNNLNDPTTGESAMRRIWFKAGPMQTNWFFANGVSFSSQYSFKLIFEALLLGPNNPGSIAVDSISLQTDYCLDFIDADIVVNPNAVMTETPPENAILHSPSGAPGNWLPLDSADSLWPNAIIPYEVDPAFSEEDLLTIMGAIEEYHNRTCIKWVTRTNEVSYVSIVNGATGCWSFVGKQGGKQLVNFDTTRPCIQHYVIVHELAHALGLIHEQSRYDRDNFVDVLWPNIQPGFQHNFKKYDREVLSTLHQPYDFDSVMHYPNNAFAKLPTLHTLEARGQSGRKLGNQDGLSILDVKKLRSAYKCSNYGPTTTPTTTTTTSTTTSTTTTTTTTTTRRPTTTSKRTTWRLYTTSRFQRPFPSRFQTIAPSVVTSPEVRKVDNENVRNDQPTDRLRQGGTGRSFSRATNVTQESTVPPELRGSNPYSNEEEMAAIACGLSGATSAPPAILAASSGYFSSPNFNQGFYPPNANCQWRILAPPGKVIRLTFLTLQLTTSPNCYNDRLVVYDGANDTTANVLGVFCGLFASPPVSSTKNALLVQFNSDPTWEANGFELFYEVVEPDVQCIAGRPVPSVATLPASNPTTLCLGMRFTCSGSIVRWEFYSGRDDGGDVYLGVFRLVSSNKYHYVGANMRRAFRKGFNQFYVPIDSQIFVQEGDFIGIFYADPRSGPVISANEIQTLRRSEVGQTVCLQAYVYKSTIETEMSNSGMINLDAFASPVVPAFRAIVQGTCGPVPIVRNAYYSSDEPVSATVGSSVTFTCEAGYHLVGSSVIDCLPTKRWNEAPFCEEEQVALLRQENELNCNFHGSLCNWQADTPSWQLSSQEEEFDFTYILTGYLASSFGQEEAKTRLVSPEMTLPLYQRPSCFQIFVRMEGFYFQQKPDTLVVLLSTNQGERPVRLIQPETGMSKTNQWRLVYVNINENGPFQVILEIREGQGRLGSVSFASSKLSEGRCPINGQPMYPNATLSGFERLNGNCPGNLMSVHLHCAACTIEQCATKCRQEGRNCAGFSYSDMQDNRCYLKATVCDAQQASPYVFYKKTIL